MKSAPVCLRAVLLAGTVLLLASHGVRAWPAPARGEPWLRVELRPQVAVQGSSVRLADIALLTSSDLGVLRRALAIPLGQVPRMGETAVLENERLAYWLKSRTGLRDEQIDWQGSRQTAVMSATQDLPGQDISAHAQAALRDHLQALARQKGLSLSRLELDPVALPASVQVPLAGGRLQVRPLGALPMGPRMLVWVDVFSADRHLRAIAVRFDVSAFARLPVAAQAMPAGAAVPASGVEMREVDVAAQPGLLGSAAWPDATAAQAAAEDAGAPVLRRALRVGEVVSADRLQARPAVSRGEWARLTTHQGLLTLESRVEVLQDGLPGQVVRARPAHATATLSARVVGPGRLELQP